MTDEMKLRKRASLEGGAVRSWGQINRYKNFHGFRFVSLFFTRKICAI